MITRLSKIALISALAFFCVLAAFSNLTDFNTNYPAIEQVLQMKSLFPHSTIGYRAINAPVLHQAAYGLIISFEALTALLCGIGAWKLFYARKASAVHFNHAKNWAVAGLTCGFLTWQVLFMSIGGEWFGMWMSPSLNGALTTAFHIFITFLAVLIYLVIKDE